jgi:hypothetical protein
MNDNWLGRVLTELAERREGIAAAALQGSAKSFEEYKDMCGEIRGLSFAHELLTDLVRKLEISNE